MTSEVEDHGLTLGQLWGAAWVLGLGAVGSVIRVLTYAADGVPVQVELFVWVLVGIVAAVFSACCAVLAGVKSAEERLRYRVSQLGMHAGD